MQLPLAGVSISEEYLRSLWDEASRVGIGREVHYHGVLPMSKALNLQKAGKYQPLTYLSL